MTRVLIVDDEAQVRELLRRFLEPEGYEIVEVETAEESGVNQSKVIGLENLRETSLSIHE